MLSSHRLLRAVYVENAGGTSRRVGVKGLILAWLEEDRSRTPVVEEKAMEVTCPALLQYTYAAVHGSAVVQLWSSGGVPHR